MIRHLSLCLLACAAGTYSHAADVYWDGSASATWADTANWSTVLSGGTTPGAIPGAADRVFFNADTFANAIATLGAAQAAQGVVFNSNAAGGITLGTLNDHTLTLGSQGMDVQAGSHIINSRITVGASQIWSNTGTGPLTVAGDLLLGANLTLNGTGNHTFGGTLAANGNRILTINNTGETRINAINTTDGTTARMIVINAAAASNVAVDGVISGIGHIHKDGAGTLTLNGANAFTGNLRIMEGTVKVNTSNVNAGQLIFGEASGAPGSSGAGTLMLDTNSAVSFRISGTSYVHPTSLGGVITFGGGGSFTPTISLAGGDRTLVVNETAAATDLLVQVGFANGDGSNRGIIKQSIGTLIMQGANTYTGATTVERGLLVMDYSVNNGDTKLSNSGAVNLRGGALELRGNADAPTNEIIGSLAAPNSTSTLILTSGNGQPLSLHATDGLVRNLSHGVLDIRTSGPATLTVGGGVANNSGGFLGGWAIFNGDRWATRTVGNQITALATEAKNEKGTWADGDNIVIDGALTGTMSTPRIASLIFDAPAGGVLDLDNPAAGLTLTTGAILVSADVTGDTAITGGQILAQQATVGATSETIITNLSTGTLSVGANLGGSNTPLSSLQVLTLAGPGEIHLTGINQVSANPSTSTNNSRLNLNGNVRVSGGNALHDYGSLVFATAGDMTSVGAILNLDGGSEGIGNISGGGGAMYSAQGSSEIRLGTGGTLVLNQTASTSTNVVIAGSGTVIKRGSGNLTFTNNVHSMSGEMHILGGAVILNGASDAFLSLNTYRLRGGELLSDQNSGGTNKVSNSANIVMQGGGGLRLTSNQAAARSESVGKLTLEGGANTLTVANTVAPGSITGSTTTTLTFSSGNPSLARSGNSTLLVRGDNLGGSASAGVAAATRVTFSNTTALNAALVGTSTTTGTNLKILPYAIADTSSAGVGSSFLTYGTNGFRALTDADYTSYGAASADSNVSVNAVAAGLAGTTINALRIVTSGGAVDLTGSSGGSLILTSGALLVSAGATDNDAMIDGFDSLLAGTSGAANDELIVQVTSSHAGAAGATLAINSAIADNGGSTSLTKSGAGTLVLGGANTYTGATTVNNGVLEFGAASGNLGAGAVRLAGGTLRWGAGNTTDITGGGRAVDLLGASAYLTPNYGGSVLTAGSVFDVGTNDVTLGGAIGNGGSGGLTKTGAGTLTLSAAPTYTGTTIINQGAMNFQSIAPNSMEGLYLVSSTGGTMSATVENGLNLQSLIVGGVYSGNAHVSGALTVNGGAVTIGDGGGDDFFLLGYRDSSATAVTSGGTVGTADFRNASSVTLNVSRVQVGTYLGTVSTNTLTSSGNLLLSNSSNHITANVFILGTSPSAVINTNALSTMNLGAGVSVFNIDTFVIGGIRSRADVTIGAGGSFTLRGQQGGETAANLFIGDNDVNSSGTGNTSSLNLTGAAAVDIKVNHLILGRMGGASNTSGWGRGTLTFATGVVEASAIRMGEANYHDAANLTGLTNTQGTINQQGTAFMRFGEISRGRGTATYNWHGGTIQNLAGADLVNQNVFITLAAGTGNATNPALRVFTVDAGQTATFHAEAGFTGSRAFTKDGAGDLVLHGTNTNSGNLHIANGRILLSADGAMDDVAWISLSSGGGFDISQRNASAYATDAVVSGTGSIGGTGATLTVGTNVGGVNSVGVLKPGGSSILDTAASSTNVGNQTGTLTVEGNLVLAASGGTRVDRAVLQVGATNRNVASAYAGDLSAWVDALPTTHGAYMSGAGTNHDLVDVEGSLTLNSTGGLSVTLASGYTGAFGDVFNLLDWTDLDATYISNGFTVGDRYRLGGETGWDLYLPELGGNYMWDTSLFTSQGVIVVVPEPGRVLLLALGIAALLFRRRR